MAIEIETLEAVPLNEKSEACQWANDGDELVNPVIESAEFALKVRHDFLIFGEYICLHLYITGN